MACHRGRGSGCPRPGALLEKVAINSTIEPPELTQDRGNRLWEGTNRTLCTRSQEKGAVTPQGTDPDLPVSVQESLAEAWVGGGLLQGWGTECSRVCMGSFNGDNLHYFHHSLSITGREHSPTHQQKIGLKIY